MESRNKKTQTSKPEAELAETKIAEVDFEFVVTFSSRVIEFWDETWSCTIRVISILVD